METWFLNHVLGLCLLVLHLGLPRPLGAGTPGNNSTDPGTAGLRYSAAADELRTAGNDATSTSYSSETLSPSQRSLLLRRAAAGSSGTETTRPITEASSGTKNPLATEPLTSNFVTITEASSSSTRTSSNNITASSSSTIRSTRTSTSSSSNINTKTSTSTSGNTSSTSSSSTSSSTSSSIRTNSTSSSSTSSSNTSSSISSSIRTSSIRTSSTSSSTTSTTSSTSSTSSSNTSRDWKDLTNTDQMPGSPRGVSEEDRTWVFTEEVSEHRDSSDSTLRMREATAPVSHTHPLTDSTYTTTISRAGERTLLSVTSSSSNSTSSAFTEKSNPHQPPSTWGVPSKPAGTEDYTHSAPSTRISEKETTAQHVTDPFKGGSEETETGGLVGYRGTQSFTGQPNATEHQHTSSSEGTSDSTPPLRATEPSTDPSEVSFSSPPPVTSPAGAPTNVSGTEHGPGSSSGASTVFSAGDHRTSTEGGTQGGTEGGTEGLASKTTEESVDWGLTAAPSTASSSTSEMNQSVTDVPPLVTSVFLTTSPVTVTQRWQMAEEDPPKSTAFSTTITSPTTTPTTFTSLAPTSSSVVTRSSTTSPPQSSASATAPYRSSSTSASTPSAQPTQHVPPGRTRGPAPGTANPTDATPLQTDASPGALTTAHSHFTTTTYAHSTPTEATEALHTTGKQTDRGSPELVVTTAPPDVQHTTPPPPKRSSNPCVSNPCTNGGMCVSNTAGEFSCSCQQGWTGPTCSQDVDECKQEPCPAGSRCINTAGSFRCECPLGFELEDGRTCTRAKTFLGTFNGNKLPQNPDVQREIIKLLNVSLSVLRGYRCSTLTKKEEDGVRIMAVNTFSIAADVMTAEVNNSIQTSLSSCNSSLAHCHVVLQYKLTYRVESLCLAQRTQCDPERSSCTDSSGTAYCQCRDGYYKHSPDDVSCLECGDGFKLENGTCVPCMFGFGGFNCGNFYKLIAVVVSPAGGALLLILVIALIVTCCRRDKNDINKIIFKSGDLQMSPYADFPKNNRISMEWGRETIEMQENGSTKNLLQMTDIYYSPALRNADLERNGLYPFPGLPGSRHSCIYPAQWNPSFISDDSRRRDYF